MYSQLSQTKHGQCPKRECGQMTRCLLEESFRGIKQICVGIESEDMAIQNMVDSETLIPTLEPYAEDKGQCRKVAGMRARS